MQTRNLGPKNLSLSPNRALSSWTLIEYINLFSEKLALSCWFSLCQFSYRIIEGALSCMITNGAARSTGIQEALRLPQNPPGGLPGASAAAARRAASTSAERIRTLHWTSIGSTCGKARARIRDRFYLCSAGRCAKL